MTDTEIQIGLMITDPSTADAADAAGLGGVTFGNAQAEQDALIAHVNARGGAAGRQLVPVYHIQNRSNSRAVEQQSTCATFTEDNQVFAAAPQFVGNVFRGCLADRRVFNATSHGLSKLDSSEFARLPGYVEVNTLSVDLISGIVVDGVRAQGYFTDGAVYGLLRVDNPSAEHGAEQVLKPRLAEMGLSFAEEAIITDPEHQSQLAQLSAEVSSAVLRFSARGVTHVMFQEPTASALAFVFMQQAESQRYRPRYAFDGDMGLTVLLGTNQIPPAQLDGAVGVGWNPGLDVVPSQQPPPNAAAEECTRILEESGVEVPADNNGRSAVMIRCDGIRYLVHLLDAAAELSFEGMIAAAQSVEQSFESALVGPTSFAADRPFGVATYRRMAWDADCPCLVHTSEPIRMPR